MKCSLVLLEYLYYKQNHSVLGKWYKMILDILIRLNQSILHYYYIGVTLATIYGKNAPGCTFHCGIAGGFAFFLVHSELWG